MSQQPIPISPNRYDLLYGGDGDSGDSDIQAGNVGDEARNTGGSSGSGDGGLPDANVDGHADVIASDAADDVQHDAVNVKSARNPAMPTRREREEHDLTHMPYRSCCRHCVRGRGRADPHLCQPCDGDEQIPIISMDYMFMNKKDQEEPTNPIIIIKDSKTKAHFAHLCTAKGGEDPWIIDRIVKDIDSLGHNKVIVKSDQERPITRVQNLVYQHRVRDCSGKLAQG